MSDRQPRHTFVTGETTRTQFDPDFRRVLLAWIRDEHERKIGRASCRERV